MSLRNFFAASATPEIIAESYQAAAAALFSTNDAMNKAGCQASLRIFAKSEERSWKRVYTPVESTEEACRIAGELPQHLTPELTVNLKQQGGGTDYYLFRIDFTPQEMRFVTLDQWAAQHHGKKKAYTAVSYAQLPKLQNLIERTISADSNLSRQDKLRCRAAYATISPPVA